MQAKSNLINLTHFLVLWWPNKHYQCKVLQVLCTATRGCTCFLRYKKINVHSGWVTVLPDKSFTVGFEWASQQGRKASVDEHSAHVSTNRQCQVRSQCLSYLNSCHIHGVGAYTDVKNNNTEKKYRRKNTSIAVYRYEKNTVTGIPKCFWYR